MNEIAHRAIVGDLTESARPGFADVSQRELPPPENSTTVSVV